MSGQLGDGTNTQRTAPVAVSGLTDVVGVAGGWGHACAVFNTGAVRCWGLNGAPRPSSPLAGWATLGGGRRPPLAASRVAP